RTSRLHLHLFEVLHQESSRTLSQI
ncbi:F-actin-capping protein subunit alpha, partial [Histoplasma capsulatum]